MAIPSVDLTTLNNLSPNLDIGDIADPALRLQAFQYIYNKLTEAVADLNAFQVGGAIKTVNLADGNVVTVKLADNAVTGPKILDGAIITAKLADGNVTTLKIADGNITRLKLADKVVGAGQLDDAAVGQSHHQDNGIPSRALGDNVILQRHMSDNSVGSAEIQAGAVQNQHIVSGAISPSQLQTGLAATADINAQFMKRGIDITSAPYSVDLSGVQSSTAAIQSACDTLGFTGGRLLFPAGIYNVGAFTIPANVELYGMPGAKFKFTRGDGSTYTVDIPRENETTGPLEYYVSPTGSATNHGLSADCPLDKVSSVLKRIPRNLFHEVVVYVANGTYTEDVMLDEWGRKAGIYINDLNLHATRNPINASYPSKTSYAVDKKRAKLAIIGETVNGVILQGRADGVTYDANIHPESGFVSRLRDVWVENFTLKNYYSGLEAHEGGAISGYNIKIRNMESVAVHAESQQAKIEVSALDVDVSGSYCIWATNGQIGISDSTIVNATASAPAILNDHGFVIVSTSTIKSKDTTVRVGVSNNNGECQILSSTLDYLTSTNRGGHLSINGTTVKNGSIGIHNKGGFVTIGGTSHIFDNTTGVQQSAGMLEIKDTDSMDGAVQKYNTAAGVKVEGGYFDYSPYSVSTLGFSVKGINGNPQTDVIHGNLVRHMVDNQAQSVAVFSGTGYTALTLSNDINALILKAKSPTPSNKITTLYTSVKDIATLVSKHVTDANSKLTEIVNALVSSGYISSATANAKYIKTGLINDTASHDIAKNAFNLLLTDLSNWGLMQP